VEYRSFTSVLTDELRGAAVENQLRGDSLSVVELHSYMHDNRKLQYQPIYAQVNRNRHHTISLIPFPLPLQENARELSPFDSDAWSVVSEGRVRCSNSTRVLLAIHTSRSPTEDLIGFLKNECMLPLYVNGMKVVSIEGVYESESTLTLLSVPLSVWTLLPDHGACRYIGKVKSNNLCQLPSVQGLFAQTGNSPIASPVDTEQNNSLYDLRSKLLEDGSEKLVLSSMGAGGSLNNEYVALGSNNARPGSTTSLQDAHVVYDAGGTLLDAVCNPQENATQLRMANAETPLTPPESDCGDLLATDPWTDLARRLHDESYSRDMVEADWPLWPLRGNPLQVDQADGQRSATNHTDTVMPWGGQLSLISNDHKRSERAATDSSIPISGPLPIPVPASPWTEFGGPAANSSSKGTSEYLVSRLPGDLVETAATSSFGTGGRRHQLDRQVGCHLTEGDRRAARIMRKNGACFRCWAMKCQCVFEEAGMRSGTCLHCQELLSGEAIRRLPCSSIKLQERTRFMLPEVLWTHLRKGRVHDFVKTHVRALVPGSFVKLSLTIGFGLPLRLDAVEFVPRGTEVSKMPVFHLANAARVRELILASPPILPFMLNREDILRQVNLWLDSVAHDGGSDFSEQCFPQPHEHWLVEMLGIICRYHQAHITDLESTDIGQHETIRWGLKMTILSHIMTYPLVVPEDEVAPLLSQLRHYQPSGNPEWICPRLANKLVKAMIFPLFGAAARRVLTNLQELLRSTTDKGTLWDQAFSLVFLCLIVIGKSQVSLVERAQIGLANGDDSYTLQDARAGIEEMEQELSIHLIGMFHLRFGTDGKGGGSGKGFNPFTMYFRDRRQCSWLMQSVVQATQNYGEYLLLKVAEHCGR
jgi:hypothetical protein